MRYAVDFSVFCLLSVDAPAAFLAISAKRSENRPHYCRFGPACPSHPSSSNSVSLYPSQLRSAPSRPSRFGRPFVLRLVQQRPLAFQLGGWRPLHPVCFDGGCWDKLRTEGHASLGRTGGGTSSGSFDTAQSWSFNLVRGVQRPGARDVKNRLLTSAIRAGVAPR